MINAKQDILRAADKIFGDIGFDAATTREIAEASGVNKALIHYHFKTKQGLFESVLDGYYERLGETLVKALQTEATLREKLAIMVDTYVDFLSQNRNFSRIVQRESSGGKNVGRIARNLNPMFRMGMEIIQAALPATKEGDLAAEHVFVSFYGIITAWFTYSGVLEILLDRDPLSSDELKRRKAHVLKMLDLTIEAIEKGRSV